MTQDQEVHPDLQLLRDAAQVHAMTRDVHEAIADLAIRPLDEKAAVRMRNLLGGDHAAAQASLQRLRLVPLDAPQEGEN